MSHLGTFAAIIELLEPSLTSFLSEASGVLEALIGPPREQPLLGGGEIDGYAGLARRGHFERLLLSEWLLADEVPEEFIRRATSNELAFHALARRDPSVKRALLVLLDAGPEQIGAPRLGHIAALVVLERRALRAGAKLVWAVVADAPAIHVAANEASFKGFVASHTDRGPTAETVARTLEAARVHGPFSETFFIGGETLRALAVGLDSRALVVADLFDPARRALELHLEQGGRRSRSVTVSLPPEPAAIRMLRRPFERESTSSGKASRPMLDLSRGVRLSFDGSFLLGVTEQGTAVVQGTGGKGRSGRTTTRTLRPGGSQRFIAVTCTRDRPTAFARAEDGTLVVHRGGAQHAYRASTPETLGRTLCAVREFGSGHDISYVLLSSEGAYRLEHGASGVADALPDLVGIASLREPGGPKPWRSARDASVQVERQGDCVHVHVDQPRGQKKTFSLGDVSGALDVHVAVDEGSRDACVVIAERGRPRATSLVVPGRPQPSEPAFVEHAFEGASLVGVVTTRAGWALVTQRSSHVVELVSVSGRTTYPSYVSPREISQVALAGCASLAAIVTTSGDVRVYDLDLCRELVRTEGLPR